MSTRVWLIAGVVCGLTLLTALRVYAQSGDGRATAPARPNIIFILVDDQRSDTLGCAGHPIIKTPVVDSLAAEGVHFRRAFVTTSICAASRASVLTGVYERTHRYSFHALPISADLMSSSYPALLHQAGYRTGFIGKYGVENEEPAAPVFDYLKPLQQGFIDQPDGTTRHETEVAGDLAVSFLKETPKDQPFCLSISFNAAHAIDRNLEPGFGHFPWPTAVDGMYDDVTIPPPRLSDPAIFESQPDFLKESLNRTRYFWRWDTPEKYQANMKAYFRMISGVDRVIGRMREALDELSLAENTVIIYTADNGYYMGDRGFAGKWSHYEESLRVPLIIYDPRLETSARGAVREELALNIDIPATIVDLAGITVPNRYQGRSLMNLMRGSKGEDWRTDFLCEFLMDHKEIPKWEGVRSTRYMYARYLVGDPPYEFLHDLVADPDERANLATDPAYQDVLMWMRRRCDVLSAQYTPSAPGPESSDGN